MAKDLTLKHHRGTPSDVAEILKKPLSQEMLNRDLARLAYVAKDGTPRVVPIAFTSNGARNTGSRRPAADPSTNEVIRSDLGAIASARHDETARSPAPPVTSPPATTPPPRGVPHGQRPLRRDESRR